MTTPENGHTKHPELMPGKVICVITYDRDGHVDLAATGPVRGKRGVLSLLDAARELVEKWEDDGL